MEDIIERLYKTGATDVTVRRSNPVLTGLSAWLINVEGGPVAGSGAGNTLAEAVADYEEDLAKAAQKAAAKLEAARAAIRPG